MLRDTVPFETLWKRIHPDARSTRFLVPFIRFLEQRFGMQAVYDVAQVPFGKPHLMHAFEIAESLREGGVISWYGPLLPAPDELQMYKWSAKYGISDDAFAGGAALEDEESALMATLAEALERYVWHHATDWYRTPRRAPYAALGARAIHPARFAGFSDEQRASNPRLAFTPESTFLWIQCESLVTNKLTYVPAQTISPAGFHWNETAGSHHREPLLHPLITTGLATWPTKTGARLRGALEVIERDAYMITWLNQLTPLRLNAAELAHTHEPLARLLEVCERYRLRAHFMRLPSDAPAYTVLAILEDTSGHKPRLSVGLDARRGCAETAEHALLEALRFHEYTKGRLNYPPEGWDPEMVPKNIIHTERSFWWAQNERDRHLDFLLAGPAQAITEEAWEHDSDEAHLTRIVSWCKEKGYEFVSASLGDSKLNPTNWAVEMVLIPELQPMHQIENEPAIGGARLTEVPRQFGYEPRPEPFLDLPHPFA